MNLHVASFEEHYISIYIYIYVINSHCHNSDLQSRMKDNMCNNNKQPKGKAC